MENKIYHLITLDYYTGDILNILNFHKLENAILRGKEFIKEWYEAQEDHSYPLDSFYADWEETHTFNGMYEIAESEFED